MGCDLIVISLVILNFQLNNSELGTAQPQLVGSFIGIFTMENEMKEKCIQATWVQMDSLLFKDQPIETRQIIIT